MQRYSAGAARARHFSHSSFKKERARVTKARRRYSMKIIGWTKAGHVGGQTALR
ncbi:hypothetical protein BO83DRAFT_379431 [Aspergillus eucalypticola CBS 122712]|uniref:Uncharacterized protein n=1 Tax=Aspergillus eucalypticola (strain CBS 122712 / IBT 29274) TaxID=1448314 RepID=A0A317VCM8_ASPEC|nr:uncharacterized protein BO83DRAFT_379431 [Aspergillus eucalypticola CBS 122712]PWY70692.1 hypothetical protein BO83DRAFT_379431 [Aspergillus eucalypticola CBS 122712]